MENKFKSIGFIAIFLTVIVMLCCGENASARGLTSILNEKGCSFVSLPCGETAVAGFSDQEMETLDIPVLIQLEVEGFGRVTQILGFAFENCGTIKNINFNRTREIGYGAFSHCYNLQSLKFPKTITKIWHNAFEYCTNLKSVEFEPFENETDFDKWGGDIFIGCKSLEQVKLTEGIKYMTGWFEDCTALKEIEIPEGTELLLSTFRRCTALEKVTLKPEEILIDPTAFGGCNKIMTLISYSKDPKDFEYEDGTKREVFSETVTENATLYIPKGTAELYKNTVTWGKFRHVVEMEAGNEVPEVISDSRLKAETCDGGIEVSGLEEQESVSVYGIDGKLMYSGAERVIRNLPKGEYIVTSGSESVKVIF